MKPNIFIQINLILILVLLVSMPTESTAHGLDVKSTLHSPDVKNIETNERVEEMLETARKQFYAAIEEIKHVETTIKLFKKIEKLAPHYVGRTQVYIGALIALKGKHAFLPHTKLKWTKRGLKIMDLGLKKAPNDIEALFVHGTLCYHLPFFFKRRDDAQRDFKKIIKQIKLEMDNYDPKLILNATVFMLKNIKLTKDEKTYLHLLKQKLEVNNSIKSQ